jgi:hypothetical protein
VQVDLYWHHWETEPPIARDITAMIVGHAASCLIQSQASTGPAHSSTDRPHSMTPHFAVPGHPVKAL